MATKTMRQTEIFKEQETPIPLDLGRDQKTLTADQLLKIIFEEKGQF